MLSEPTRTALSTIQLVTTAHVVARHPEAFTSGRFLGAPCQAEVFPSNEGGFCLTMLYGEA